jgi:hypothetical protein
MRQNNHTGPELAYWIKKYLLFRRTRSFTSLVTEGGFGSLHVRVAAVGQDMIGWTEFLHGKVSVEIAAIQKLHCMSSLACQLTGTDWMKAFISHLLQMSHFQWIFHNYTLHDKQRGYLRLCLRSDTLHEINCCWRPLRPKSPLKVSICWNWTIPPCTMRGTRIRLTGSWH